jgi:hypothetical protein
MCIKRTEHIQSILDMICICTFSVCPLEMLQKHYLFHKSLIARSYVFLSIDLDNIEEKEKHCAYRVIKGERHEKSIITKKEDFIDFIKTTKATFGETKLKNKSRAWQNMVFTG